MAEKAGEYMREEGIQFLRPCIPLRIEQLEAGAPGRLRVTAKRTDNNEELVDEYNTVLFAIGRDPCTDTIGLENAGISHKIVVNVYLTLIIICDLKAL